PAVATGDGVALAFHAGARLADLEFVQFHPTALSLPGAPRFLISEALRGEGARLVNGRGEPFMTRYHEDGDLAPRDVVARGIVRELEAGGGPVSLTLAHLDAARVRHRFPTIAAMCLGVGIDIAKDLIPVGPAAHYLMGGIDTDTWGRTSVGGLFAAGETACTGVHGANRLASNSLLEGLVFGARAARAMLGPIAPAQFHSDRQWRPVPETTADAGGDGGAMGIDAIRDAMWRGAGLFRTRAGLADTLAKLNAAYAAVRIDADTADADAWRRFNLLTVARLISRAALRREESRGGHFRQDFPKRDDLHWQVHLIDAFRM
ncbi:MAG: FAD-binding protein, partial [Vicinamibacterales bacterium]